MITSEFFRKCAICLWSKVGSTAVEEIIQFFLMPEIIVGIQFEAKLVDYFEVTYLWHAYPGGLCMR